MISQVHDILKKMIKLSKQKKELLDFVYAVHKLFAEELDIQKSLFILAIDNYFLKSSYNAEQEEYWDIRTNELQDADRFSRLADIVFKEINFNSDSDIKIEIQDIDMLTGYIIARSIDEGNDLVAILEEIKDFFFLICKSI